MILTAKLDVQELREIAKKVRDYKDDVNKKIEIALNNIADLGIQVAYQHIGNTFGSYIEFTKNVNDENGKITAYVIGMNTAPFISEYMRDDQLVSVEVNSLFIEEFGTGQFAENPHNYPKGGRGTFPRDDGLPSKGLQDMWMFKTTDGDWIKSRGRTPRAPMHHAYIEMQQQIIAEFKKAFGGGNG